MIKRTEASVKRFSAAQKWLSGLDNETASTLITVSSDIALVVNPGEPGVIYDVAFGSDELAREFESTALSGKLWVDTVTADSRPKIEAMLRDARSDAPPRWRHVNHIVSGGTELPITYSAVPVGAKGRVVALGRNMRPFATMQKQLIEAQRSMEREYSRLRQVETRHRLLFQVAAEAVIIVDAESYKVVEANPAAAQVLGNAGRRFVGRSLFDLFDAQNRRTIEALFAKVTSVGHAAESPVRSTSLGSREFRISASLFHEGRSAFLMVRLLPGEAERGDLSQQRRKSQVLELVETSPDGFVVTDSKGKVQLANHAFLEFVQLATEEQVRGEPLDRWLGSPGVDFALLTGQLRDRQTLRLFSTTLRGEYGSATDVEISGVDVPDAEEPCFGFMVRDVSSRLPARRRSGTERPRSVEQLTELVGRVPLKELVRESTDMIERLCIEAALELTNDNRASAAEVLGLSRQSLYAKLHRHGIADIGGGDESGKGLRKRS
jgi:transcriptional regulator PpsR